MVHTKEVSPPKNKGLGIRTQLLIHTDDLAKHGEEFNRTHLRKNWESIGRQGLKVIGCVVRMCRCLLIYDK